MLKLMLSVTAALIRAENRPRVSGADRLVYW